VTEGISVSEFSSIKGDTALAIMAQRWFPDGEINHLGFPEELRIIVDRGSGSKICDIAGNEYIDFMLGMGPLILGHAHPSITRAVAEQVAKGSTFYALNEPIIRLADEIGEASACAERIRFTLSGTEATLGAIRFAKAFTGRHKILKFEGGFHGGHDAALMSMAPAHPPPFPQAVPDSAGISPTVPPEVLIAPFNDLDTTAKLVESFAPEIACIIVEPLQRYLSPIAGFLQGLRELASQHQIILVFDEVVTGFRLAYGGAQEYYGVTPDIVAYGKGLGGGFPIGAIAGRAEILDLCRRRQSKETRVYQSGTLSGNPISAVAALATLEELRKPGIYPRLTELGARARKGLREVFLRADVRVQVLGDGPLLNVVFTELPVTDYRSSLSGDRKKSLRFHSELLRQGLFVNPYGRIYLSTVHTNEDLDALFVAAEKAIRTISQELGSKQ